MVGPEGGGTGPGWPAPPRVSPGPSAPPPLCRELWGPREAARYQGDSRGGLQRLVPPGACSHSGLRRAAARVLLPQGYPESVSPDYLQYQCWDALQALCSTLTGALATRAVLQAVGVGDSAATVTGATLTWVLRDGVGMVTRIAFAWLQGTRLDCEAKQWRLVADVLNDLALVLELLAPAWPPIGPALLTLAAAVKCIVGVAGGATRAALAVHQARRDNMADVAAKDSSQETLVNGAGLLLALLLLPLLEGRPWLTGLVVTLLLVTHLGANVGAVGALCLPTLNRPRLRLALGGALRGVVRGGGALAHRPIWEDGGVINVPSPEDVNPREPLLPGFSTRLNLHLGAPLHRLVKSEAEFKKALECGTEDYIIVLRPSQGGTPPACWVGGGPRDPGVWGAPRCPRGGWGSQDPGVQPGPRCPGGGWGSRGPRDPRETQVSPGWVGVPGTQASRGDPGGWVRSLDVWHGWGGSRGPRLLGGTQVGWVGVPGRVVWVWGVTGTQAPGVGWVGASQRRRCSGLGGGGSQWPRWVNGSHRDPGFWGWVEGVPVT
ncbi:RUS family member 1 isoform X2 [Falco rusticolus]|uniref:RUS family member 1 isoform X2 n=1 Tax=Falco rusticolus TaxID=120794 RepID=UPI00188694EC|nr:RUS family member 1 isoform X2 [Falco rusticolus]